MDRERWSPSNIKEGGFPCPHCTVGSIHLDDKSVSQEETPASKEGHGHPAWEPEWIEATFTCAFRCGNPNCKGVVFAIGKVSVSSWRTEDEEGTDESLTPQYFTPPLRMISVPSEASVAVRDDVDGAFALYWADPGAASNRIRAAAERLLTDLGVSRFVTSKSRKRRFLALSERIHRLRDARPEIASQLDAIKFVGNEGSHARAVTREDVLDALEIFESVLDAIYVRNAERLSGIVKRINKRKKPRSVKRARVRKNPWFD